MEAFNKQFDVCYLNTNKQVVVVTIEAHDRHEAYTVVGAKPDCRKWRATPTITSITEHAVAWH